MANTPLPLPSLPDKKRFFDNLYALHDLVGEDDEDCMRSEASLVQQQLQRELEENEKGTNTTASATCKDKPLRVASSPLPGGQMPPKRLEKTGLQQLERVPVTLPSSLSFTFEDKKPLRRRKETAGSTQKTVDRSCLLFSGLCFYFIPNNLKNAVRKLKIKRASEHGAFCLNEWRPDAVSHIVVDSSYRYPNALKALKIDRIPDHIIVVRDTYPSDCLHYRRILDHLQPIYAVPGSEPPAPPRNSPDQSPTSLQIKDRTSPAKETPRGSSRTSSESKESTPDIPQGSGPSSNKSALRMAKSQEQLLQGNELDVMILQARALPFLDEATETEGDSDTDSSGRPKKRIQKDQTSHARKQADSTEGFQCMTAHDGSEKNDNPNARTIMILSEMEQYYGRTKDEWRSIGYRKAIATLRKQNHRITFASEAIKLPNIGVRLAAKIEEIVQTDRLKRLQYANQDPRDSTLKLFLGIYGVGMSHAEKWVSAGYKTLKDLKDKGHLSHSQRIGIEHYVDFNSRIPRDEVRQHGELVVETARKIDENLVLQIMGSYRRGAKDCGDIDIMLTKKDADNHEMRGALDSLVNELTQIGFLQCGLAVPHGRDDGSKWHGASKLKDGLPWRRIDFLIVPWAERGAALLYFTGNDIFNRSIRLLASRKGFRLNQRGLYKDVLRGPRRRRITDGTLVEGESEEKIFELLGVPFRPPEQRCC